MGFIIQSNLLESMPIFHQRILFYLIESVGSIKFRPTLTIFSPVINFFLLLKKHILVEFAWPLFGDSGERIGG
ncbi:hypothetical protein FGO68_gene12624 [Halteria grandinella]|uniref:Uncharacterized protein n=1 Tax=Halteria grandinella TaxID=5974 RepID=A0A8J8T943_HALGN|nr:hypothetical protein FGO68_gene12624 [Halteria grandinella]